jgi:hypothetical protein
MEQRLPQVCGEEGLQAEERHELRTDTRPQSEPRTTGDAHPPIDVLQNRE